MPLISAQVISLWQSKMTEMINSFGRTVTAIGQPSTIDCYNCTYDYQNKRSGNKYTPSPSGIPFGPGQTCPVCGGYGRITVQNNNSFIATVQTERKEIQNKNGVIEHRNVARLKTFLVNFDYMANCVEMRIRDKSYIPLTPPVKKGLGEDFLAIGDFVEK